MPATITATELKIRRVLTRHAIDEHWPITPRLLGRIAKVAAAAAAVPRPADPPKGPEGGRKRPRTPAAPSAGPGPAPGPPEAASGAPAASPLEVACPTCGALPWTRCHNEFGIRAKDHHASRRRLAGAGAS